MTSVLSRQNLAISSLDKPDSACISRFLIKSSLSTSSSREGNANEDSPCGCSKEGAGVVGWGAICALAEARVAAKNDSVSQEMGGRGEDWKKRLAEGTGGGGPDSVS